MILDDKVIMYLPPPLPPPPPYLPNPNGSLDRQPASPTQGNPPPPFSEAPHHGSQPGRSLRLSTLPSHILLQIVYNTFPTYPTLDTGLSFYIACMNVLRSTYLPAYTSLLRPYYSSDPFPSTVVPQSLSSSLNTVQRETPVLDLFIALKVREDVCVDDSELHLEREDMFKDIFDHAQPKARLEDLIRICGMKEGVITLAPPGVIVYTSTGGSTHSSANETVRASASRKPSLPLPSPVQAPPCPTPSRSSTSRFFSAFKRHPKPPSPPSTVVSLNQRQNRSPQQSTRIRPIPFSLLSISYGTRKVGLQLMSVETGSKRTIVEVQRMSRDEQLETTAGRVVGELRALLVG
ncbi:hypothetical protein DFP72DRAFT_805818 [Ephemerocybe angulata]|uniref:Uncharacterized protein n=1 Tax=Ephemerocybe angulata TaxID=980116 RepID=A0A8H6MBP2_9AGAR|nr:hypothetical protein DFP72DRAFT_805818 [Tulosesus angulatus]